MYRRTFFKRACLAAAAISLNRTTADEAGDTILRLPPDINHPIKIDSLEILKAGSSVFVRCRSAEGVTGLAVCNKRFEYTIPLAKDCILPIFLGRDACDLELLLGEVYTRNSNYKLAGLPFWNAVGAVEPAILDMLGRTAKKPVAELLGTVLRKEIPVYISSLRRDTSPGQEVEWVGRRLAESGPTACKLKIGGRMSNNKDAAPGRTDRLIPLARKSFGDGIAIYVDANSSYDAKTAIEVGRMLQAHGVGFYEEPCPWEDYEATKQVADALEITVAGGEQDSSQWRWREMISKHIVDLAQPDVSYNGGLIRTLRVARMAEKAGMKITPHSPNAGYGCAYMLHFAAVTPNIGPHMEFHGEAKPEHWLIEKPIVKNGTVSLPPGHGLGYTVEPSYLEKAKAV